MEAQRRMSAFLTPEVPGMLSGVCALGLGWVLLQPGVPDLRLVLFFSVVLGLTNLCWVMAVPVRSGETIGYLQWLPWLLNFTIVGTSVTWAWWLFLGAGDFMTPEVVLGSVIVGLVSGLFLQRAPGWVVIGMVGGAGGVLVAVAVVLGAVSQYWHVNHRIGMYVGAICMGAIGLTMALPLMIGSVIVFKKSGRQRGELECVGCGYNLLGTIEAGRGVCPECGYEMKAERGPVRGDGLEG